MAIVTDVPSPEWKDVPMDEEDPIEIRAFEVTGSI